MSKVFKKDQQSFIRAKLSTNEKWAKTALIRIFAFQTEEEQSSETTSVYNNVGFTGADAEILSSFAKQLLAKGWLSDKQMKIVFKKMPKYTRQIIEISNEEKLNALIIK